MMVQILGVLEVVISGAWNVSLFVLINHIRLGMHVDLWTFTDR